MKKYMTYAVMAFFATIAISLAAPDKDAMMAKETAAWQAFKDKKPDEMPAKSMMPIIGLPQTQP